MNKVEANQVKSDYLKQLNEYVRHELKNKLGSIIIDIRKIDDFSIPTKTRGEKLNINKNVYEIENLLDEIKDVILWNEVR